MTFDSMRKHCAKFPWCWLRSEVSLRVSTRWRAIPFRVTSRVSPTLTSCRISFGMSFRIPGLQVPDQLRRTTASLSFDERDRMMPKSPLNLAARINSIRIRVRQQRGIPPAQRVMPVMRTRPGIGGFTTLCLYQDPVGCMRSSVEQLRPIASRKWIDMGFRGLRRSLLLRPQYSASG